MKRDLSLPMLDLKGQPYTDASTLRDVCFAALSANLPTDANMTAGDKLKIYALASKIVPEGVVDLTAEELVLLKDRIGKALFPLVVGRAFELLEKDL